MEQEYTKKSMLWIAAVCLVILAGILYLFAYPKTSTQTPLQTGTATTTLPSETYGLSEYTDSTYGFSFWYPNTLQVTTKSSQDGTNFPGGVAVETLQIGSAGNTSIIVVNSPTGTITDEPNNHASPIGQTKFFYDSTSGTWMVAYPDSVLEGNGIVATTSADVSKTTMSGLVMLPSGRRFDTTIIPLSTSRFLVVSDGGGSSFTPELAQTIAAIGASVNPLTEATALEAEATAYKASETYYKGMVVCSDKNDCPTGDSCVTPGPIMAGGQTPKVCVPSNKTVPL